MNALKSLPIAVALTLLFNRPVSAQQMHPSTAMQSVEFTLSQAKQVIPSDFLGLSFETLSIEPDKAGSYTYFSAENVSLIRLFRTLGIHSLRIGGNTSDTPTVPVPTTADIDTLFRFAHAADATVIYTLRLRESGPDRVVPAAKYVMSHYADQVACIVIGNEPDVYEKTAAEDDLQILRYVDAMHKGGVTPMPRVCGPSTRPNHSDWAAQFAADLTGKADILWVTQHSYPGGNGRKVMSAEVGRDAMLDGSWDEHYQSLLDSFSTGIGQHGIQYRIEETNNYYFGGAKDVSDTFAAALWGLDYLYWWAEHGAAGVNFHTGNQVAAADEQTPCWYATFWTEGNAVQVKPIAYALAAFHAGARGEVLTQRRTNPDKDLSVHATRAANGDFYVTLLNRSHGASGHPSEIALQPSSRFQTAEVLVMGSKDGRVEAKDGITLGSAPITREGRWDGRWRSIRLSEGAARIAVPPASALVVHLHR